MSSALVVWAEGARVGLLTAEGGAWRFEYADEWLSHPGRFQLSPRFPVVAGAVDDTSDERPVQWFFDNLLPEGGVRQALARSARIDPRDTFGLLARFGEESAGALTLLPVDRPFPAAGSYERISRAKLNGYLASRPEMPLLAAGGRAKMSLAGAQHKLPVRWDGSNFFLPVGAASSHILKPDNARATDYPFCPANEHFCMVLAGRFGLPAPRSDLIRTPAPVYVVARYDRIVEGAVVRRRHQIDLCQMMNKWPGYKYESDGGATFQEAYAALAALRQPAVGRDQLLRWLIFNFVIGNSDAHAKNISFLVESAGYDLAPPYDLLCVKAYGDDEMAMSIGKQGRYGWVTAEAWDELADSLGIRSTLLRRLRKEAAKTLPKLAAELVKSDDFTKEERAFLAGVVDIIVRHAAFALEGA